MIEQKFYCSCGMRYRNRMHLESHFRNPSVPNYEHEEITGEQWEAKFIHGEKDNE